MKKIIALLFVLLLSLLVLWSQTGSTVNFTGEELLGRIGNSSVTVNVAADKDLEVYFEHGTASGAYTAQTATTTFPGGAPFNVVMDKLQPNTRYYYRMRYREPGASTFAAGAEHTFQTQRPRGSTFTFVLQFDPHMDENSDSDVYKLTLQNELADNPDFLIDLGDTFMSDKQNPVTAQVVMDRVHLLRSYYDILCHSVPLFLSLGNHEGEWGKNLNGTANNVAVWDTLARKQYFPNPVPDSFFSGDTKIDPLVGQRQSYFSWEWGDALFVVLDPFWSQPVSPEQSGDWSQTLGRDQYNWLKQTLESSTATYKFVLAHDLIGGINPNGLGPMRGGIEAAKYLEWGGYNLDNTYGFDKARPGWPMPIHNLLVANKVTVFYHGHDHLYAKQDLDGIVYQEGPQPSAKNANLGSRGADYGYKLGTILGGRGYIRVQVSPSGVKSEYVETWLPSEVTATQENGMVADSYSIPPGGAATSKVPTVSRVNTAAGGIPTIAPNTWVEVMGSNLAPVGGPRTWKASDFVNNQMPKQLDGVSVTVNGKTAYLSYISSSQVNILTPPDAMTGPVPVEVTVNGVTSATFTAQAQAVAPAFFLFNTGPYVTATHADGSLVGPNNLYKGLSSPAKPGETVVLYASGFGATSTPVVAGSTVQSGILATLPVIRIGSMAATAQFAGLISPGLFQFNVVVPSGTPDGDQPISATYNGLTSPAGTLLTIKH